MRSLFLLLSTMGCLLAGGALVLLPSSPSRAMDAAVDAEGGGAPLEITADGALEWRRDGQQMVARDNAVARQGALSVAAQILTADYRDKKDGGAEIWRLTAAGDVRIRSADSEARGDQAVYEIARGVAVMTGQSLMLSTPEQTVTARDSFEYWVNGNQLKALGGAKVVRGADTLSADTLSAYFSQGADGKRALDRVEASGHVVITTPTERAEGARGVYDAKTQIATLSGGVSLHRGPNTLRGERAEVNLSTRISRLIGGRSPETGGPGRVHGVFFPGSTDKPDSESPASGADAP